MIDWLYEHYVAIRESTPLMLALYWIPVAVGLLGFFIEWIQEYREDLKESVERHYHPRLTIGTILGRILISFIPIVNVGWVIFHHLWAIGRNIIDLCSKWLAIPIVRHKWVPKPEDSDPLGMNRRR